MQRHQSRNLPSDILYRTIHLNTSTHWLCFIVTHPDILFCIVKDSSLQSRSPHGSRGCLGLLLTLLDWMFPGAHHGTLLMLPYRHACNPSWLTLDGSLKSPWILTQHPQVLQIIFHVTWGIFSSLSVDVLMMSWQEKKKKRQYLEFLVAKLIKKLLA